MAELKAGHLEEDQLQVRLVTPERVLVDRIVEAVELPAKTGYLEVLYGAAPLLAELGAGEVRVHTGAGETTRYSVAWGFAEVLPARVTILAESAFRPEEIDVAKAQRDLEEGQREWNEAGEDAAAYEHANEVMAEAQSRLESAERR